MTGKIELREGMGRSEGFFQMAWRRFRRHPLARLGGWVLLLLYLGALFADFLAPYPESKSFRQFSYAPPTHIFWRDTDGRLTRPYVCASERRRNLETFRVEVVTDCSKGRYPIYFFVHGEPYKFLGFIPANLRLLGGDWLVSEQAHLFIWGTDDFGRDLWGRIWYGARVSLTVGILATGLALIIGVFFGGIAGFYAGRPVTLSVGFANPEFRRYLRRGRPLLAWLKALGWTLVWLGLAWLLWITLQGFLQTSRGLEAILAGVIGVALLGAIGYFLIWQTVKLDLDTLIMRTTEVLAAIPDSFFAHHPLGADSPGYPPRHPLHVGGFDPLLRQLGGVGPHGAQPGVAATGDGVRPSRPGPGGFRCAHANPAHPARNLHLPHRDRYPLDSQLHPGGVGAFFLGAGYPRTRFFLGIVAI